MKCTLTAPVDVQRFAVLAEMGWLERRPELQTLCRAARDKGGRLTIEVVREAFGAAINDRAAENIASWCRDVLLVDAHGALTPHGQDAAESGQVAEPEMGVYEWWCAAHPLFGTRILHARRLAATRTGRLEDTEPLPLRPAAGVIFASVVNPDQRFLLRGFPQRHGEIACMPLTSDADVRLRWDLDFKKGDNSWQLEGELDVAAGAKSPVRATPARFEIDLARLFARWAEQHVAVRGTWDEGDRVFRMRFADVTPAARDSFRQRFEIERAEVPAVGSFSNVAIEDVPVGPAGERDARDWAAARFWDALAREARHRTRSELRRRFADLVEETPLERWRPELPAHAKLLEGLSSKPEIYWRVAAAVDLSPAPIDAAELGAFRPGKVEDGADGPPGKGGGRAGVVRVPHGAERPMAWIVAELLGEAKPLRILLCDRYVRGDSNLLALSLFAQAVRARSKEARVDVATTPVDGQPIPAAKIREATGGEVLGYDGVFGSDRHRWPHSRYLVVQQVGGGGAGAIAWDMTNSVLDARTPAAPPSGGTIGPDTPLRWRDVTAVKLAADEIPQDLARWLTRERR